MIRGGILEIIRDDFSELYVALTKNLSWRDEFLENINYQNSQPKIAKKKKKGILSRSITLQEIEEIIKVLILPPKTMSLGDLTREV